jgi:hypothetical protein
MMMRVEHVLLGDQEVRVSVDRGKEAQTNETDVFSRQHGRPRRGKLASRRSAWTIRVRRWTFEVVTDQ